MVRNDALLPVSVVHVVDDDPGVRDALANLLHSAGFRVAVHASPAAFLSRQVTSEPGCVVLDLHFEDSNGLDMQASLLERSDPMPVILMTGYADVPSSVRGMKAGAIDFLEKPIDEDALLTAVQDALRRAECQVAGEARLNEVRRRYATLTSREKEVMDLVNAGLMNKQVAGRLALSEITVKVHRGSMMRKMNVRTVADLVRVAELLKHGAGGM